MTATIPDDVTATTKPKVRLGKQAAFGSDSARGLTAREYMATACMAALLAAPDTGEWPKNQFAEAAVANADALLAELAK